MKLHFIDMDRDLVEALSAAFAGISDVTCATGDILEVAHTALVSPANSYGFMDGGIDAAYAAFFGPAVQIAVQDAINRRPEGYLPVGASLVVRTRHARIPLLIVAPTMHTPEEVPASNCYRALRAVLRLADSTPELGADIRFKA